MSEVSLPSSFQASLEAIYASELTVGRNHLADNIRTAATASIRWALVNGCSGDIIKEQEDRRHTLEFSSEVKFQGKVCDEAVLFGLAARMVMTKKRFSKGYVESHYDLLPQTPIHLTLNNKWERPAAIIVPAPNDETSATVVVGNCVNDEAQMKEIAHIIKCMR